MNGKQTYSVNKWASRSVILHLISTWNIYVICAKLNFFTRISCCLSNFFFPVILFSRYFHLWLSRSFILFALHFRALNQMILYTVNCCSALCSHCRFSNSYSADEQKKYKKRPTKKYSNSVRENTVNSIRLMKKSDWIFRTKCEQKWKKIREKKNNHLKQQHLKKWINKVSNTTKNITSLSNVLFAAAMQMKKYFIHLREPFVFPVWFLFIQMISRSVFLLSGRFVCVLFRFFVVVVFSLIFSFDSCISVGIRFGCWISDWPSNVSFAVYLPNYLGYSHFIASNHKHSRNIPCANSQRKKFWLITVYARLKAVALLLHTLLTRLSHLRWSNGPI